MYQNDPCKVLTGEVRLSYANLTTPKAPSGGGDPVYSCTLLIPKTDTATYNDLVSAIEAAKQLGLAQKWQARPPAALRMPLYDGDQAMPSGKPWGEECRGHWVLRTKANISHPPMVVHQSNIHATLAPSDVYSGMFARVTVRMYAYASSGNDGIGAGLGNVMKTRDGEPLAGGANAEQDFAELETAAPAAPGAMPAYLQQPAAAPAAVPAYAPQPAVAAPAQAPQGYGIDPITGQLIPLP